MLHLKWLSFIFSSTARLPLTRSWTAQATETGAVGLVDDLDLVASSSVAL